jgi:hypothetical protein
MSIKREMQKNPSRLQELLKLASNLHWSSYMIASRVPLLQYSGDARTRRTDAVENEKSQ